MGRCITTCTGLSDGDYQSCNGCQVYATCVRGRLIDNRPCMAGGVWDDIRKSCVIKSTTCPEKDTYGSTTSTGPACIRDCIGRRQIDYQSCKGCRIYATCASGGILIDYRPCAQKDTFWDDKRKACVYKSSTCTESTGPTTPRKTPPTTPTRRPPPPITTPPTSAGCIDYCKGKRNDDYPACAFNCHYYATCDNDRLIDGRPCPAGLFWDDRRKDCNYHCYPGTGPGPSPTPASTGPPSPTPSTQKPPTTPHSHCKDYCKGKRNIDYPSCAFNCSYYATCDNDRLIDGRPCPAGLFWDDQRKACNYHCYPGTGPGPSPTPASTGPPSPTPSTQKPPTTPHSHCKDYCKGKRNIDYPSCAFNCSYYATCDNGRVIDGRPCPAGLFWDDQRKACNYHCYPGGDTSSPRPPTTTPSTTPSTTPPTTTPGRCGHYCDGKRNINYPSCAFNCHYYATCENGHLTDGRLCADNTFWDDQRKACNYRCYPGGDTSSPQPPTTTPSTTPSTTPPTPTPTRCGHYCDGKRNIDYPSCAFNCHYYATCDNGRLIDGRPCPDGLFWDDQRKACNYHCYPVTTSTTPPITTPSTSPPTGPTTPTPTTTPPITTPPTSTPEGPTPTKEPPTTTPCATTAPPPLPTKPCVDCCETMHDGDYHSCENCHEYVTCSNGRLTKRTKCPAGSAWDDKLKECSQSSSTCKNPGLDDCICSCTHRLDGHYASCEGNRYFATCLRQILFDKLECPSGYHWSGKHRRCVD